MMAEIVITDETLIQGIKKQSLFIKQRDELFGKVIETLLLIHNHGWPLPEDGTVEWLEYEQLITKTDDGKFYRCTDEGLTLAHWLNELRDSLGRHIRMETE